MKNNTPSDILQVYRPRILTGQLIVVDRHSRKTADGPIVNTLRVVPHFYRTKKFSVLWIFFRVIEPGTWSHRLYRTGVPAMMCEGWTSPGHHLPLYIWCFFLRMNENERIHFSPLNKRDRL
ncbi:hypothetical protein QTP88_008412 [Uroleucon formosanum]